MAWTYQRNGRVPDGAALPAGMRRFAAVVEYDGSDHPGWQRQAHCAGIQQWVETALSRVGDEAIAVVCAGRTDAGVHATAQVIHFDSRAARSPRNWQCGANANLPASIRLQWVDEIQPSFHARFSALARTYRYVVHDAATDPALLRAFSCRERRSLDIEAMRTAARALIGEHDFSAFRAAGCQSPTPLRYLSDLQIWRQGSLVVMEVTANAFLLHMVRNLAGTLLAVGRGERPPQWLAELLASRQRTLGAATAPAQGLYLVGVHYPPAFVVPALVGGPCFLSAAAPHPVTAPLWQRPAVKRPQ